MIFEKNQKNIFNILCNLGILGYMFLFGGMYTYVYFYGTTILEVCIIVFIGSTLLVIQYHYLKMLNFKDRLLELLIILTVNGYCFFYKPQNITVSLIILVVAVITCILVNRKKIEKIYV
ncbi:hypothetical protein ABE42_40600 [Bacillus thuringiensis]|nr:hypothetical protein [Bacillus thuringiensis]